MHSVERPETKKKPTSGRARREQGFENLVRMGRLYQAGRVLVEAVKLGLFDRLSGRPCSARVLANQTGRSAAALERMLRVLAEAGLVVKQGGGFRNASCAGEFLCRGKPGYLGDFITHSESLQGAWASLGRTLRTGRMAAPGESRLQSYRRRLKGFLLAMDAAGQTQADKIRTLIDPKACDTLLDVGGGLGTYALSFAAANPDLRAVVYDLPDVVRLARSRIQKSGLKNRVRVQAGQCLEDPLPEGPFSLVLLSNLLHIYSPEDCRRIVGRAARVLERGGSLVVHDYLFGCGDQLAVALFDITMLVGTPEGKCYDLKDVRSWMRAAGIRRIQSAPVLAGTSVLWGIKK